MVSERTREPQYQGIVTLRQTKGLTSLGIMTNGTWDEDPRRLVFLLARYKFVAKMLAGKEQVLEVGCGDAFGTRVVQQDVGSVCAVDFDPVFIDDIQGRMDEKWRFEVKQHDMLASPLQQLYDAAYALDVIEHIDAKDEEKFIINIVQSLKAPGVLIIGTPSIQSQPYAADDSKQGHVNCKDHEQLRELMVKFFYDAFIFSMNDEVVHTGFYPMAHYLFALCVGKRDRREIG